MPQLDRSAIKPYEELRRQSLAALGALASVQFLAVPTDQLPVRSFAAYILADPDESLELQSAAIWALAAMNRPHDSTIRTLLESTHHRLVAPTFAFRWETTKNNKTGERYERSNIDRH